MTVAMQLHRQFSCQRACIAVEFAPAEHQYQSWTLDLAVAHHPSSLTLPGNLSIYAGFGRLPETPRKLSPTECKLYPCHGYTFRVLISPGKSSPRHGENLRASIRPEIHDRCRYLAPPTLLAGASVLHFHDQVLLQVLQSLCDDICNAITLAIQLPTGLHCS